MRRGIWPIVAALAVSILCVGPTLGAGSKTNGEETRTLQRGFLVEATYEDTTTVRYVALYTAALSDTSATAGANECDYTGYARVAVPRTAGGWTVSGNTCSNTATISFPTCTGGSDTATYFAILRYVDPNWTILYWDDLTSSLAITTNVTPQFAAGALVITED